MMNPPIDDAIEFACPCCGGRGLPTCICEGKGRLPNEEAERAARLMAARWYEEPAANAVSGVRFKIAERIREIALAEFANERTTIAITLRRVAHELKEEARAIDGERSAQRHAENLRREQAYLDKTRTHADGENITSKEAT